MSRARIAWISLLVIAIVAVIGGVVLASIDQRAITERVVRRVAAVSSETLGRDVTFESARGRLLPNPRVTIHRLAVAGRPGEAPLLESEELRVHLRAWPILRSLGREIVIDEVTVVRPSVHLVRDAEGSWNFEGLGPKEGGRAAEVTLDRLSMEDGTVRVIDAGARGRESSVALTRLDVRADVDDGSRAELELELRGALASDEQNLAIELALAPRAVPSAGVEGEPVWPSVEGTIALRDAELVRLGGLLPAGIENVVRGGRLDVEADVATDEDGKYELHADASLAGVRLRGEPASGRMRLSTKVDPEAPSALRARVERVALSGPGVELAGTGAFTWKPRSVSFDLAGPLLDLDVLLAAMPEREPQARGAAVLPPSLRKTLGETAARGTLRIARVVRGSLELRDVTARARLRGGVLELDEGAAQLYGGRVVVNGTRADLRPAAPEWTVRARIENADLGAMTREIAGDQALLGRLEGTLEVSGSGAAWEHVQRSASGTAALRIRDGALTTGDVGQSVASAMQDALRLTGRSDARMPDLGDGQTELRDLRLAFRIEDGALVLRDRLVATLPFGSARLGGRIGLDRSLDLDGTVALAPELVSQALGVRVGAPIEVPLSIGGSLSAPSIAPGSPEVIARQLAQSAVREGTRALQEELEERIEREVGEGAGDLLRDLGKGIFRGP